MECLNSLQRQLVIDPRRRVRQRAAHRLLRQLRAQVAERRRARQALRRLDCLAQPLAARHFAEYKDREFLTAVDRGQLASSWPSGGRKAARARTRSAWWSRQTRWSLLRPRPMSRRSRRARRAALALAVMSVLVAASHRPGQPAVTRPRGSSSIKDRSQRSWQPGIELAIAAVTVIRVGVCTAPARADGGQRRASQNSACEDSLASKQGERAVAQPGSGRI
jgi:hypothetical protein